MVMLLRIIGLLLAIVILVPVLSGVRSIFSGVANEALSFLTIRPDEDETISLPFQAKNLSVDEEVELRMLELINKERTSVGAPPLVMNERLTKLARSHSEDMWRRQYFSHINLDGEDPFDRMEEADIKYRIAGENLALARTVERAHRGLMDSLGHRKNILDPKFRRVGIGAVDGGIYGKMFTQNFTD